MKTFLDRLLLGGLLIAVLFCLGLGATGCTRGATPPLAPDEDGPRVEDPVEGGGTVKPAPSEDSEQGTRPVGHRPAPEKPAPPDEDSSRAR